MKKRRFFLKAKKSHMSLARRRNRRKHIHQRVINRRKMFNMIYMMEAPLQAVC